MRRRVDTAKSTIIGLERVNEQVVYRHVFANADREVGGVLVGRVPLRGGLPLVTGAIEALAADEQRATLTFTQDAWSHVHATLDRDFPENEQIVGWYHSHPGFGIFLSGHDLFIHKNFFAGVSQVALVVDPHACTEGVFVWRDGEVEPLFERPTPPGWQPVGIPPGRPVGEDPAVERTARVAPPQTRRISPLLYGLLGIVLGLLVWQAIRPTSEPTRTRPTARQPAGAPSGRTVGQPKRPQNSAPTTPTAPAPQPSPVTPPATSTVPAPTSASPPPGAPENEGDGKPGGTTP